jgi:hypothetical protein
MVAPGRDRESRSRQRAERTRSDGPAGQAFNPLTAINWYSAAWASDPLQAAPADGGVISTWRNGGTLGTAHTQGTNDARPLYRAAAATLNNRPAFDFDGTDDFLRIATASLAQPFVVYAVVVPRAFAATRSVIGLNTANASRRLGFTTAGAPALNLTTALNGNVALTVNQSTILGGLASGVDSAVLGGWGNESSATGDAGTTAINQVVVGAGHTASPGNFFNGLVAFYGICTQAEQGNLPATFFTDLKAFYVP